MKNKLFSLLFLVLISHNVLAQRITFDPHKNNFLVEDPSKENQTIKSFKKGQTVELYIKNYNPFLFSYSVEITTKDDTKKLFDFVSGILSNNYGVTIKSLTEENLNAESTDNLTSFKKTYKKYLELELKLKSPFFNCTEIKNHLSNINEEILNKYQNLSTDEASKLNITKNEVIALSELKINAKYYIDNIQNNDKCLYKIGEYIAKGNSNTIKIKLKAKKEKNASIYIDSIVGTKEIPVKNSFKVDFSSGLFLTKNNSPQYFKKVKDSENYILGQEKLNKYQIGINALAHVYLDESNNLNLTLGSGITIDKSIHLLLGGSYRIKESNIFLNLGLDLSNQDTLSDSMEIGNEYSNAVEIEKKTIWENNLWFGISYKL